jgi:hypothetical protein
VLVSDAAAMALAQPAPVPVATAGAFRPPVIAPPVVPVRAPFAITATLGPARLSNLRKEENYTSYSSFGGTALGLSGVQRSGVVQQVPASGTVTDGALRSETNLRAGASWRLGASGRGWVATFGGLLGSYYKEEAPEVPVAVLETHPTVTVVELTGLGEAGFWMTSRTSASVQLHGGIGSGWVDREVEEAAGDPDAARWGYQARVGWRASNRWTIGGELDATVSVLQFHNIKWTQETYHFAIVLRAELPHRRTPRAACRRAPRWLAAS